MNTTRKFWFVSLTGKLSAALLLGIILLANARPSTVLAAPVYSCGNAASGHCYGLNDWPGTVNGAKTTIYSVPLSCSGCATWYGQETGFVDNEMWVIDRTCPNLCWVEAGYMTVSGLFGTTVNYFWADQRPGSSLVVHVLSQVPKTDYYWSYTTYSISRSSSTSFEVDIFNGFDYAYTSYSTNNTMTPNDINIGQELAGSGGASAPQAKFFNNIWIAANTNLPHYQSDNGSITSSNPPFAGYITLPSQSPIGGTIYTSCC